MNINIIVSMILALVTFPQDADFSIWFRNYKITFSAYIENKKDIGIFIKIVDEEKEEVVYTDTWWECAHIENGIRIPHTERILKMLNNTKSTVESF